MNQYNTSYAAILKPCSWMDAFKTAEGTVGPNSYRQVPTVRLPIPYAPNVQSC